MEPDGHVQREDAHEDERRPQEQVQGQLHRGVLLGADAGSAHGPAEDALRAHLAARAPDADQEVHRQHGDLVEEEEHEEVERHEDAVDAGDEEEEERVELLAPLLHRPRREGPGEDDDRRQEHHQEAHAVDGELVLDPERRDQRELLVELKARRLPVVGHVDRDGEHEAEARADDGQPAHEKRPVARGEHDEHGGHEGQPGDGGEDGPAGHGHPSQWNHTRSKRTPRATP